MRLSEQKHIVRSSREILADLNDVEMVRSLILLRIKILKAEEQRLAKRRQLPLFRNPR